MKNTEDLLDTGKVQFNKIKSEMESLGVQVVLGRNEAKEAFDREWKNLTEFIEEQSHRLRRKSYWANRLLEDLTQRATVLKNSLHQATPDEEKIYNLWRERTLRSIYEVELIISELYSVLTDDEKDLLSDLRIKMEMYRTHLIQVSLKELGPLNIQKAQLANRIDDVLTWREHDTEASREKIQRFGTELGTSFDHIKRAFSELFK